MSSTALRVDGPLLERDREFAVLDRLIADTRDARGGVVLIQAEAGLGKSRLLREGIMRARNAGIASLSARAGELERDFSFGVMLQLLGPVILRATDDERAELFRGAAVHALPLFDPAAGAGGDASMDRTFALYHGLHWLLVNLAERSPLLLAVDDAHWADAQSLAFLAYLGQRVDELAVGLAVTIRTGEPAASDDLLERLQDLPDAQMARPLPLSAAACARLVRDALPGADDAFCAACSEASGGNPFFLRELLASARSEEITPHAAAAPRILALTPAAVSRSVLARMGRLPAAARDLAAAVAVLGEGAQLADAAELGGLEREEAADAARALERAQVFAEVEPLSFGHPIVRASVYEDLPPGRRSGAHARAAGLAQARGAAQEAVAAHLLLAERGHGGWVAQALGAAAQAAHRRAATAAAARYLRRALEEPIRDEARGELLAALGQAEADAGDEGSLEHLRAASGLTADPQRRAAALRDLATLLVHRGRYAEASDAARAGLALLAEADDGVATACATELEACELIGMHWGVVVAEREESWLRVERLLSSSELERTPAGRALLGHAAIGEGYAGRRRARAIELAHRALSVGEPTAHRLDGMAFALASFALIVAGEPEDAERATTLAITAGRRRGSILDVAPSAHVRSIARYRAGRLGGAATDAADAVEAGHHGWGATLPMAHAYLGMTWLERGDASACERALELPGGESRWKGNPSWGAYLIGRGRLRLHRGDARGAREDFEQCGALAELVGARNPAVLPWRSWAARCAHASGDGERARALAGQELELARRFGAPRAVARALRVAGTLDAGTAGLALLEEAVALLEAAPDRLEHAYARFDLGTALRRTGRREAARTHLAKALDIAHRCEAHALVERSFEELRVAGARPRRPAMRGVAALTPSERRVAALAVGGMANREIAESLFVTRRTVEMHLSNAYRKLDIRSRDELEDVLGPSSDQP